MHAARIVTLIDELHSALLAAPPEQQEFAATLLRSGPLWEGNQRDGNFGLAMAEMLDDMADWARPPATTLVIAHGAPSNLRWPSGR